MHKDKLFDYICKNYPVAESSYIIHNILIWVSLQSMDKEDTISTLLCLLDGIGITRKEIEEYGYLQ